MNKISELMPILNGHFHWNKARMTCFANLIMALIKVRTVNWMALACAFGSEAQLDSRYNSRP